MSIAQMVSAEIASTVSSPDISLDIVVHTVCYYRGSETFDGSTGYQIVYSWANAPRLSERGKQTIERHAVTLKAFAKELRCEAGGYSQQVPLRIVNETRIVFTFRDEMRGTQGNIDHLVNIERDNMLGIIVCHDLWNNIYDSIRWFKEHSVNWD